MILINNSTPKSGSSLLQGWERDLLNVHCETTGTRSGIKQLKELLGGTTYIRQLTMDLAVRLLELEQEIGSLYIKIHAGRSPAVEFLLEQDCVRMVFSCRDPRDAWMSLLDEWNRLGSEEPEFHAGCDPTQLAIERTAALTGLYLSLKSDPRVIFIRYEELMKDQGGTMQRIVADLGLEANSQCEEEVLARYLPGSPLVPKRFNKGTSDRWRNELCESEQNRVSEALGYLAFQMGYHDELAREQFEQTIKDSDRLFDTRSKVDFSDKIKWIETDQSQES